MAIGHVVLQSTRRALLALDESHDFFIGADIAFQNLRWQMLGFSAAFPSATQEEISQKFALGGNPGSNAFNLVFRREPPVVAELAAEVRLTSIVAIYEGWASSAAAELGVKPPGVERWLKFVQPWEPSTSPTTMPRYFGNPIPELADLAALCRANRLNRSSHLRVLLICFRAFKEVRNSLSHAERRASDRTVDRYGRYASVLPTWSATGTPPVLPPFQIGDALAVASLRFGDFSAVIRSLIVTFDGLVSDRRAALDAAAAHWVDTYGSGVVLPAGDVKAKSAFARRWRQSNLPTPATIDPLISELRRRRIIMF